MTDPVGRRSRTVRMPLRVDHDERRARIVETYLALIAREGFDAATSRALAADLGFTLSSIWHYFPNQQALVAAAAQTVVDRTTARIVAATRDLSALPALAAMMREILPTGPETRDEARVIVAFRGGPATRGLVRPRLDCESEWRSTVERRLREAVAAGHLVARTIVSSLADLVQSVWFGEQVASTVSTGDEDRGRAERVLDTALVA